MDEHRMWWETLFQIHEYAMFPDVAQRLTEREVDFLAAVLNLTPSMTILDVACGNGRHVLELARRGYRADGVELATPIVEAVNAKISELQYPARIFERDMRDLADLGSYDVILIMNSSLGFFSDAEHQTMLNDLRNLLAPNGRIVLQCINPYAITNYMQHYQRGWHAVEEGYVLRDSAFNPLTGCIETNYRYIEPATGETVHPGERIRLYTFLEWRTMLQRAGFEVAAVFGDAILPVVPFEASSQWQVIVAKGK